MKSKSRLKSFGGFQACTVAYVKDEHSHCDIPVVCENEFQSLDFGILISWGPELTILDEES